MSDLSRRNPYCLTITVELDDQIEDPKDQESAEKLLARDVSKFLREVEWGYGRRRISSVYREPYIPPPPKS